MSERVPLIGFHRDLLQKHFGPSGSNLMEEFPQQALLNLLQTADAADVMCVVWGRYAAFDIFHHAALIDRPEPWVLSASQR